MPYDDSDVKKMIKYQTERKVGFSKSKKIGDEVKDLIHCILEAQVERRYTVEQITQHPWMQSAIVASPPAAGPAATRSHSPASSVAAGGGPARMTIIAGETGAGTGRVAATTTTAAVGNDSMSQNNNSNVEKVFSRLLSNILHSVHSFFPNASKTNLQSHELELAAHYAMESAVDREHLRTKASQIWPRRRSRIFMALRRPWR